MSRIMSSPLVTALELEHAAAVLLMLVGYLGLLWGLYLLVTTSPQSAGGQETARDEDTAPVTAGTRLDDEAGR